MPKPTADRYTLKLSQEEAQLLVQSIIELQARAIREHGVSDPSIARGEDVKIRILQSCAMWDVL